MDWFKQIFEQVATLFHWWVIILPWEAGLRIRFGKKVKVLGPGIHFRIPYLDVCYKQPTRLNFVMLSPQTLTSRSKETITICLQVGYTIKDILKVFLSVGELQGSICGAIQGIVSEYVSQNDLINCSPYNIQLNCKKVLTEKDWGIEINELQVTTYAIVRTYRLISDSAWMPSNHHLDVKI